jgi:hypothetical protein
MRLNRRKNRESESRRKRAAERTAESASEGPPEKDDERRRSLADAVRSVRSGKDDSGPRKPRADPKKRRKPRAEADGEKRRRRRAGENRSRKRGADAGKRRERVAALARRRKEVARAAKSVGADALGVAREILRWPARIWMTVAEALGSVILAVWRRAAMPALRLVRRVLKAGLLLGERTVTPARGLAVVALAATIALGGSQFGDYRAVQVGTPQYVEVEDVAQAPEVAREMPRSAHGISVFAIAVACLFVTVFSVWRNWRLARLLLFLGLAVVAISLFIDRPEGLQLGTTGEAYAGADAVLLGSFWVQLFAGVTLAVVGPLLAAQLRGERAVRGRRSRARPGRDETDSKRAPRLRPGVGT